MIKVLRILLLNLSIVFNTTILLFPNHFTFHINLAGKYSLATPYFNWCCGIDAAMSWHSQELKSGLENKPNLLMGIKLCKLWLAKRLLDKGCRESYQTDISLMNSVINNNLYS